MPISKEFRRLVIAGLLIRLLLLVYAAFHDSYFRVKYTDIDYMIIVDGAKEMIGGGSPFDRTTFRYTPLLAVLMIPAAVVANPLGKLVFMAADLGAAVYCYLFLRSYASEKSARQMVSLFILFNPIVLNVSTRGNSDMLITFMSMFVLHKFQEKKYILSAAMLGFAIHFKIYPVIYVLPLVLGLYESSAKERKWVTRMLKVCIRCVYLGVVCVMCFSIPTYLCYLAYGKTYIDEAFLYHAKREDHRHNFSPYWLLMYLNMGRRYLGVGEEYSAGFFAFIPQLIVLLFVAWKLRHNVAHACGVMTVVFIAFNKVCTVQYFVWFIPFLSFFFYKPLEDANEEMQWAALGKRERKNQYHPPSIWTILLVFVLWGATIPLWMTTATKLEFEGKNYFGQLYVVSCIFFFATVCLASWLARVARASQTQRRAMSKHFIDKSLKKNYL